MECNARADRHWWIWCSGTRAARWWGWKTRCCYVNLQLDHTHILAQKFGPSILATSIRRRFPSILIFQGSHDQSAAFQLSPNQEAAGGRETKRAAFGKAVHKHSNGIRTGWNFHFEWKTAQFLSSQFLFIRDWLWLEFSERLSGPYTEHGWVMMTPPQSSRLISMGLQTFQVMMMSNR